MMGPVRVNETACLRLSQVVRPPRDLPEQVVQPGCLGILDTESGVFDFITDGWLAELGRGLDLPQVLGWLSRSDPSS